MKIILEPADLLETEVILRGDVTGAEAQAILEFLRKKPGSNKLFVSKEEEQFLVDAREVVYLETNGSKVTVHTKNGIYDSRLKLYELKELLAPFAFAQINKSTLVNIDFVQSIQAEFSGNYRVKLKNQKDVLTISRKYFKEFKARIQEVSL